MCLCLQRVVSEEYAIKMEASLKTWVSAWDSMGYSPDELDKGVPHCKGWGCKRSPGVLGLTDRNSNTCHQRPLRYCQCWSN
jgi:hypothetical protein